MAPGSTGVHLDLVSEVQKAKAEEVAVKVKEHKRRAHLNPPTHRACEGASVRLNAFPTEHQQAVGKPKVSA